MKELKVYTISEDRLQILELSSVTHALRMLNCARGLIRLWRRKFRVCEGHRELNCHISSPGRNLTI